VGWEWQNEHAPDCPVTAGRISLAEELERDPENAALLGAVPEWDRGGDEEAEHCACGLVEHSSLSMTRQVTVTEEAHKSAIEDLLGDLARMVGPEETLAYVERVAERMREELAT
jgi:hypothetical protein